MTVEDVFLAALELDDDHTRRNYLDHACGENAALRQEVEELLDSHSRDGSFLDVPAAQQLQLDSSPQGIKSSHPDEQLGTILDGKYKLIESIGEGGMGTIYLAQQLAPIVRKVAVKVVKAGMDSKAVLARFESERQALAMMDHPNIAKVLDAGATPSGRPFFVMELVKGVPITRFCDDRKLTPRERLELLVPVCQAIQHAHQKGIIHRDIKPSNVLVALYDDRPMPKVIDFGVAKAVVGPAPTDQTQMTGFGMVVGTPEYMSPEQASLNNLDIDTRSDVYSLGVLLYELLTGTTPVDGKSLHEAGFLEILRIVREGETRKPSTKLSQLDNLPNVAAQRGVEPAHLLKLIRGELDWVVLKAVEKDRSRRYETVNALSRDIQRFLADEVVEARPPSRGYRLRKFARRHRGPLLAASLVLFTLLAGIVGTVWGLVLSQRNERKALAAVEQERRATELTAARLKQIEIINNTVFDIFSEFDIRKVKEGNDPVEAVLAQKLIAAGNTLDAQAIQEPLVLANLQNRLGQTLVNLGHASAAIPFLVSAMEIRTAKLEPDHADVLATINNLASAYQAAGQSHAAMPLREQLFALAKTKYGPDHSDTLTAMNNLALMYGAIGNPEKALALLEEVWKLRVAKLGPDHPDTLTSIVNLAGAYRNTDKRDHVIPLYEEALTRMKAHHDSGHPDILTVMNNLALAYKDAGKRAKAVSLYEETLALRKAKLGADHPETLNSMNNLAAAYHDSGRLDKALPLYEETLAIRRVTLGADHPSTLSSMNNLALGYKAAGKLDQAIPLYEQSLAVRKVKLGLDHPSTQTARGNLAKAYDADQQFAKAELLYRERYAIIQQKSGSESSDAASAARSLAENLMEQRKWPEAEPLLRDCLSIREKKEPDGFETAHLQSMLGGALIGQKKYAEAEPLLRKSFEKLNERKRSPSTRRQNVIRATLDRLIELSRATNQPDEVAKWQAERAKYRESAPRPKEVN